MFKKLGINILTVNAVYACGCLKDVIKDAAIDEFKKKINEEDERQMKYIKSLVTDPNSVISHTNALNNDELLKANTLVLEKVTDEAKKKVGKIYEENLKEIIDRAKYGNNSRFYFFSIKVKDDYNLDGLIEFDGSKVKPEKNKEVEKLEVVLSRDNVKEALKLGFFRLETLASFFIDK